MLLYRATRSRLSIKGAPSRYPRPLKVAACSIDLTKKMQRTERVHQHTGKTPHRLTSGGNKYLIAIYVAA